MKNSAKMFLFGFSSCHRESKTKDKTGLCSRQIDYQNKYVEKAEEMFLDTYTAVPENTRQVSRQGS